METEFRARRNTLLRQAVHADPELVEAAAERIQSYIVRQRLEAHDSAIEAYQKSGMVTTEIHAILPKEFRQDLLAPVLQQYENERHALKQGFEVPGLTVEKLGRKESL